MKTEQKIEIIEYYSYIRLPEDHKVSIYYQTQRPVNDPWGTQQSEIQYYLNGMSVSRKELPRSITDSIIAELVATASIIERRSDYISA